MIDSHTAEPPWRQVLVHFHDYATAEEAGAVHIGPEMARAESEGLIATWFFIRKNPCWRLRFQLANNGSAQDAVRFVRERLTRLQFAGYIARYVECIYEPETHAFGGNEGMGIAHRLFHADSHHLASYLASGQPHFPGNHGDLRRELTVLLCTNLMRAAGQDWYEQGDIWARIADMRTAPPDTPSSSGLESALRRLMTVDTSPTGALMGEGGSLAALSTWFAAFTHAGRSLGDLAHHGKLARGLRAVLAHHVIFHWNRMGLPLETQCALAGTARTVVLGCDERSPLR